MNYGKYDIICCKCYFYSLICNEFFCIDQISNSHNSTMIINKQKNLCLKNFDYLYMKKTRVSQNFENSNIITGDLQV